MIQWENSVGILNASIIIIGMMFMGSWEELYVNAIKVSDSQ